jgi:hypothetical protein
MPLDTRHLSDQKVCSKNIDSHHRRARVTPSISQPYPYVFMDGVWHKRSWSGAARACGDLRASEWTPGVDRRGRQGMKEDTQSWRSFVSSLIPRGPAGVRMVTGETARRTRPDATTPYRKRTEHRAHDRQKQFAQDSGHYPITSHYSRAFKRQSA